MLLLPLMAGAQVLNEFRIQTTFLGKTDTGLRKFTMGVETNSTGKWKLISRANITTGRNLQLAEVKPDSTLSGLRFTDLLNNKEFHRLYELTLNEYLDRIDATDPLGINTPQNTTDHKIFRDAQTGNLNISIKAGEKDNEAIIRVCNVDNSKMIVLNKPLRPFSGNLLEIGTTSFGQGTFLVVVSTPTCRFSASITIF